MEDGGLHVHTRSSTPLHTKPEGRRLAGEPPRIPRDRHTKIKAQGSLKNQHKVTTSCSHTLFRVSLALHLIELVVNLRI
jgi:hypothetical protein